MSNIIIEGKKITTTTNEEVQNSEIGIKNGVYTIKKNLISTFSADIYSYDDYNVLFSNEVMFNEMYLVVVLFNDETQKGWKLLSINDHLDVNIQRLTDINFLVVGDNKNTEDLGQISFCQTQGSGKVNEIIISFSELTQCEVVDKKYIILSFVEEVDEHDGKKGFIHTVGIYKPDGKIEKNIIDERSDKKLNYTFNVDGDIVSFTLDNDGITQNICEYKLGQNSQNNSDELNENVQKTISDEFENLQAEISTSENLIESSEKSEQPSDNSGQQDSVEHKKDLSSFKDLLQKIEKK